MSVRREGEVNHYVWIFFYILRRIASLVNDWVHAGGTYLGWRVVCKDVNLVARIALGKRHIQQDDYADCMDSKVQMLNSAKHHHQETAAPTYQPAFESISITENPFLSLTLCAKHRCLTAPFRL